jgi:hypothetical protein
MNYRIIADTPMGTVVIGWSNKDTISLQGLSRFGYTNIRVEKIDDENESCLLTSIESRE